MDPWRAATSGLMVVAAGIRLWRHWRRRPLGRRKPSGDHRARYDDVPPVKVVLREDPPPPTLGTNWYSHFDHPPSDLRWTRPDPPPPPPKTPGMENIGRPTIIVKHVWPDR